MRVYLAGCVDVSPSHQSNSHAVFHDVWQGQCLALSPFDAAVLPICTQVKRPQVYNWNFKVCTACRELRVLNTPFLISANMGASHVGEKLPRGVNKHTCTISCYRG